MMNHFSELALRNLWVRKTRTLLTACGIMLAVAAMLAVSVMSASSAEALRNFFAEASGRANLTITDAGTSGEGFPVRTLRRVQSFPGVADAVGTTTNSALLLSKDKPVSFSVMGIDPLTDSRMRTYDLTTGRLLAERARSYDILLVDEFAAKHKIALGDTVSLALPDGSEEKFDVVGLISDKGAGHLQGGNVAFVNLEVAQDVFGRGARLDSVDLIAAPGLADSPERLGELKDQLGAMLGDKYVVEFPSATGESVSQAMGSFYVGMGIFSMIAVFVGALLIYNTFAMSIAERKREIGMLRALGVTKRQVLSLVLVEACILGVVGSNLGVGAGFLLAIPLVKSIGSIMGLALEGFVVPPESVAQAVVIGFIATIIAALLPAWQASRVSPIEALRARAGGTEGRLMRYGWILGLLLLVLASLDVGAVGTSGSSLFLILTFLGTILLLPNIIALLEHVLRPAVTSIYGPMGELGSRNLVRSKARSTLTVGLLMISVVMSIAIGAMGTSFKLSLENWITSALGGDYIISSSQPMRDDVMRDVAQVQGISGVTPERWLYVKMAGIMRQDGFERKEDPMLLIGVDPATRSGITAFQFTEGEDGQAVLADFNAGNAIVISTMLRDRWNVRRGDSIRLHTGRGDHDFLVAGLVASFLQGGQVMYTTRQEIREYYGDTRISMLLAKRAAGFSSAEVEQRLENGIAKSRHLDVVSGEQYRQGILTQSEQFFSLFDAMVWIAVLVAALGVANTLTMSVLERVREIGTLRSIGMTRVQIVWMILSEAGAMGTLGAAFGFLVALAISRNGIEGMSKATGFPMVYVFPISAAVAGVAVALIVSQVAALYPTWRAGRLNVIEAIKEE